MKWAYWISTGLLTLLMMGSAGMYFFNNAAVQEAFTNLGYPTYIIYPLATAKILGLVVLWTKPSAFITEWAYAGFFYNTLLAFFAHVMVGDGAFGGALVAMILVLVSYFSSKRLAT